MRRRYFLFSGIFVPCGTFGPPRRESAGGVCQGKVSERSKEHAWKVCIPQKGIAGSNPAFSARYPSDPLKAPPNFGGLFVCMRPANGVNPRRRCILRRESYGRRAEPRRDSAVRGSARPIPDHTSVAGPAAGTRVESIRTFFRHCFSGLPENGSWPRPPGTVRAGPIGPNPRFPDTCRKRNFLLPRVLQDSGSIFECFRNGPEKNLPRLSAKAPGGV